MGFKSLFMSTDETKRDEWLLKLSDLSERLKDQRMKVSVLSDDHEQTRQALEKSSAELADANQDYHITVKELQQHIAT